jgi:uncharacterized protein
LQKTDKDILFSAGDVVNFLSCAHHTTLDLMDLEIPLPKDISSEELELVREKGYVHENQYAQKLRQGCGSFLDIWQAGDTLRERTKATCDAMRSGTEVIYQPVLQNGQLYGTADFLIRVAAPSQLGGYSYEVTDTKLALSVRARFVIQLAVYSKILGAIQGVEPALMRVVLGDMSEKGYACKDYSRYMARLLERFFAQAEAWQNGNPIETYPEPRDHCEICRWMDLCEKKRADDDHLWQVAGIRKTQIKKLQGAGISTLAGLGRADPETRVAGMAPQTLKNLHHQARLQLLKKETGQNHLEMLPVAEKEIRGFARLPKPDPGDLFFDMEGDPFEQGGLEYLFGLYFFDKGQPVFKDFWAHSRTGEKIAFEQFMDFVMDRLSKYPNAHIYHYAHYEQTALKKLMSLHGTREAEVDNLLRAGKLVDLYKVVKEGMRISEPSYSIKNLEHFYMESRTGDVQSAGASIVFYEKWKETGDKSLLEKIRDYNLDDVRST